MIGILYKIKPNEYICYSENRGFSVIEDLSKLDDTIIWISNLKDSLQKNIKKENFFNIRFKEIIYFYNINDIDASRQFAVIIKFFNSLVEIFKEEYSFFNLKSSDFIDIDNFTEILFKSKFNIDINNSFEFLENNFNKEIEFKNIKKNNFFISYFQNYDFVKSLFDINIPYGDYKIIDVVSLSKNKDPFLIMETIEKDKCFMFECSFDQQPIIKTLFPEKGDFGWFNNIELNYLKGRCKLEAKRVIIFDKKIRIKDLMRTRLKTKYLNFPFNIFSLNLIESIKINNNEILNIWIESYEKIFFMDKVLDLIMNDIEIGYLIGNKLVIGIDDVNKINILENNSLMYPIKLIRYIINN